MKRIEDALHGYIRLDEEEVSILDTPEIQRLRRIRQLALSSYVYPSATHTRFEHSLGVMHFAGKFAESMDLSERQRKMVRFAGLMHDSGHGPFSHASEVIAEKNGLSHEDFSCKVIDKLEDDISIDTGQIKDLIRGDHELGIIAGDIDADRLDYLIRDAHSSGLEYGMIDYETIISSANLRAGKPVFDERAIPALESLFTSRFHMIKTLYTHHTAEIAEKMLQRSLENLLEDRDVEEIMRMDDYTAHNVLLNSEGISKKIYDRISERSLYKTALEWGEGDLTREGLKIMEKRIDEPKKMEEKIAEEAGIENHKVILDKPKTPEIQHIEVNILKDNVQNLQQLSPVPESLKHAEWRTVALKVYAPEENKKEVRKAAKKVLEKYRNALQEFVE